MNVNPVAGVGASTPAAATTRTPKADGEGFGASISKALEELERLHDKTDALAQQAATGDLESVTDYVVAATEAQLATQVTTAVRNRAVEAFNDIMRMPV